MADLSPSHRSRIPLKNDTNMSSSAKRALSVGNDGDSDSNAKKKKVINVDVDWSIGKFLKVLVENSFRRERDHDGSQAEMRFWLKLFQDLFDVYTSKSRSSLMDLFSMSDEKERFLYVQKHKQYWEKKISVLKRFSCALFEVDEDFFHELLIFITMFEGNPLMDKIALHLPRFKQDLNAIYVGAYNRIEWRYLMKVTCSSEKRAMSALKSIVPKGSIVAATDDEVVNLKYSLQAPKIYQLKNSNLTSKGWGQYVRLEEVHDWLLLHPSSVKDGFFWE